MVRASQVIATSCALAALVAFPALAQEPDRDGTAKPAPAESDAGATAEKPAEPPRPADPRRYPQGISSPDGRPAPAKRDLSRYPEGVTVVTPQTPAIPPVDAGAFPEGVTVVGGRTPPRTGPRVRVVVEPGLEPPEPITEELPQADPSPSEVGMGPAAAPPGSESKTIGPSIDEQQAAFAQPPREAGSILPPLAGWTPTSGFPDAPPNPAGYPREPTRWFPPIRDPTWRPTGSWPEGQDQSNWNPSSWIAPVFDPVWTPRDSWGRTLGLPADPLLAGATLPEEASSPPDAALPPNAAEPEPVKREQRTGSAADTPTDEQRTTEDGER